MCIFHWIKYGCGYEALRKDIDQSLCTSYVKLSSIAPTFLCLNKKRSYLYEPHRCNHCRVCDLENACLASCIGPRNRKRDCWNEPFRCNRCRVCDLENPILASYTADGRGGQSYWAKVCRRHPVVAGRRTLMGNPSLPSDTENCKACAQQAKDREEDDRLIYTAKAVYRKGAKDSDKSWELSCRLIAQESQEAQEVPQDLIDIFCSQLQDMKLAQHSKPSLPMQRTDFNPGVVPTAVDQIRATSKPRSSGESSQHAAQDLDDQLIKLGLEEARSGRWTLSYQAPYAQYPTMHRDQYWEPLQKRPQNGLLMDYVSSKLMLHQGKENRHRCAAQIIHGEMRVILQSLGLYNKEVDTWMHVDLQKQDLSDRKIGAVIHLFLRKIRVLHWAFNCAEETAA